MLTAKPLTDAVALLADLAEDPHAHEDSALGELRSRYPDQAFQLIHDVEDYDGSVHRDLIIRAPGSPTVSVSVAPPDGLPWPLRGVVRSHDRDLLEVNGTRVEVAEAMAGVDMIVRDRSLMRTVVDGCLLKAELDREPVELTDDDVQQAANAFRRAKRLWTGDQTRTWLLDRGLTVDTFGELVRRQAELEALRRRIVPSEAADEWFERHAAELAELVVAWVEQDDSVDRERLAVEPLTEVLAAAARGRRSGVVRVRAGDVPGDSGTLADAVVGEVNAIMIDGPAVAVVLQRQPARLDDSSRALARERAFEEWLADRRRTARITWFWGEREHTR